MIAAVHCPFCAIVRQNNPDVREVYRDERAVAFFPTRPATPGHTLIVPRVHVPYIWELGSRDSEHLGVLISRMSGLLVNTVGAEGLNVLQSNGEAATQTVDHIHLHLVPRWANDSIGRFWPTEVSYSLQAIDDIWGALRDACKELKP